MSKDAKRWRALLLALCAVGIAFLAVDLFDGYAGKWGSAGTGTASAGRSYLQKLTTIAPGSAAARSGLRAGDVLDTRPMSVPDRYRLSNRKYMGQSIRVYVASPNGLTPHTMGAKTNPIFTWDVWFGFAGNAWMLLFAGILAMRRPESRDAHLLALVLIGLTMQQALSAYDWITPWAVLDAVAACVSWLWYICLALLATYSLSFARPASRARQALLWISYAVAFSTSALGVAGVFAQCTGVVDPNSPILSGPWSDFVTYGLPFVFPLLCGIVTAVETRGAERTRYLWAFIPLALVYVAGFVNFTVGVFYPHYGQALNAAVNVALVLSPLGLTYSLLNRRLLDIGFALNRAAIFSAVSVVLVGTFVLVEWLISKWLQIDNHSANIAVSGAVALGLGLSMRLVHAKVEHVVDNVMFRKRRADEEAIRKMAREAPYITDRGTLLARVERVLLQNADASSVHVLLDDERGHYGDVNENDPALVSIRAEHAPLDLHATQTAIEGEWAYPMVARGRLIGALVLGPKNSQESYAPDESAAIATLAHSTAGALDVLSTRSETSEVGATLARIVTMLENMSPGAANKI